MAKTSAAYIHDDDGPAWVAVFGGTDPDDGKAAQHAAALARAEGKTIGGPQWITEPQLNRGKPFRIYRLLPAA